MMYWVKNDYCPLIYMDWIVRRFSSFPLHLVVDGAMTLISNTYFCKWPYYLLNVPTFTMSCLKNKVPSLMISVSKNICFNISVLQGIKLDVGNKIYSNKQYIHRKS